MTTCEIGHLFHNLAHICNRIFMKIFNKKVPVKFWKSPASDVRIGIRIRTRDLDLDQICHGGGLRSPSALVRIVKVY